MSDNNYTPRAGSLPGKMTGFFAANPDEELMLDDIVEKFDVTRNNIHTLLKPAVDAGLLARAKNDDGEHIYTAGKNEPADEAAQRFVPSPASVWGSPARRARQPRVLFDVSALKLDLIKVDDTMPIPAPMRRGKNKWGPLFAKLKKPGQNMPIPAAIHCAVNSEANKRKKNKRGAYIVRRMSATESRIWRIE